MKTPTPGEIRAAVASAWLYMTLAELALDGMVPREERMEARALAIDAYKAMEGRPLEVLRYLMTNEESKE